MWVCLIPGGLPLVLSWGERWLRLASTLSVAPSACRGVRGERALDGAGCPQPSLRPSVGLHSEKRVTGCLIQKSLSLIQKSPNLSFSAVTL